MNELVSKVKTFFSMNSRVSLRNNKNSIELKQFKETRINNWDKCMHPDHIHCSENVKTKMACSQNEPFVMPEEYGDILVSVRSDSCTVEKLFHKIDREVWKNPDIPMINTIQKDVEEFVYSLLQKLKEKNQKWDCNLIKCGSYYEGLRVGLPYEFDYMLELQYFKAVEIILNQDSTKVYSPRYLDNMEVKFITTAGGRHSVNVCYPQAQLEYIEFKRNMVPDVREILWKYKSKGDLKLIEVSDHNNSPNLCLFFTYNGEGIMVDLVTCVKFPVTCENKLPGFNEDTLNFIRDIVPEVPSDASKECVTKFITSNLHLVSTSVENRWRISTSNLDVIIMKHVPNNIKCSLRVIKHLCNLHLTYDDTFDLKRFERSEGLQYFGYKQFVPTYMLKLLFLYEVILLYGKHKSWQLEKNVDEEISIKLLAHLNQCQECGKRPFNQAKVEVRSFLFGKGYIHKFLFGQDLALLQQTNPVWYIERLKSIRDIVENNGRLQLSGNCFKQLNYPLIEGVACYPSRRFYAS